MFRQPRPRRFLQLLWRFGAILRKVPILDRRAVIDVNVGAPEAPADDLVGLEVSATALAMRPRLLALWRQDGEVDLHCIGLRFSRSAYLTISMSSTSTQLNISALSSAEFEIGPMSEATIGHVGLIRTGPNGANGTA